MKKNLLVTTGLSLSLFSFGGCEKKPFSNLSARDPAPPAVERITPEQRAAATKLVAVKDPVLEEIHAFRVEVRRDYNSRHFDELEARAKDLCASKATFDNGSWKIVQFYGSFACRDEEPESMWQLHDTIHQAWIAARPQSITARVAYAEFLADYAWKARGSSFADGVTEAGWKLFGDRLASARVLIENARTLPEKDPCLWMAALRVALGEGWPKLDYDELVAEAKAFAPTFWGYDATRAYSLLPRWHGQPGDWEDYAAQAAARPDGLGSETYARIVMNLRGYYENVFRETKASWPKTREGLARMREKYPRSFDVVNESAMLATMAGDQALAKEMFDRLGDTYLASVWRKPERFAHFRHWAETGTR